MKDFPLAFSVFIVLERADKSLTRNRFTIDCWAVETLCLSGDKVLFCMLEEWFYSDALFLNLNYPEKDLAWPSNGNVGIFIYFYFFEPNLPDIDLIS